MFFRAVGSCGGVGRRNAGRSADFQEEAIGARRGRARVTAIEKRDGEHLWAQRDELHTP
jgi:hypothetical protein